MNARFLHDDISSLFSKLIYFLFTNSVLSNISLVVLSVYSRIIYSVSSLSFIVMAWLDLCCYQLLDLLFILRLFHLRICTLVLCYSFFIRIFIPITFEAVLGQCLYIYSMCLILFLVICRLHNLFWFSIIAFGWAHFLSRRTLSASSSLSSLDSTFTTSFLLVSMSTSFITKTTSFEHCFPCLANRRYVNVRSALEVQ